MPAERHAGGPMQAGLQLRLCTGRKLREQFVPSRRRAEQADIGHVEVCQGVQGFEVGAGDVGHHQRCVRRRHQSGQRLRGAERMQGAGAGQAVGAQQGRAVVGHLRQPAHHPRQVQQRRRFGSGAEQQQPGYRCYLHGQRARIGMRRVERKCAQVRGVHADPDRQRLPRRVRDFKSVNQGLSGAGNRPGQHPHAAAAARARAEQQVVVVAGVEHRRFRRAAGDDARGQGLERGLQAAAGKRAGALPVGGHQGQGAGLAVGRTFGVGDQRECEGLALFAKCARGFQYGQQAAAGDHGDGSVSGASSASRSASQGSSTQRWREG